MLYPGILSIRPEPREFAYDDAFTILYALGVGCGPRDEDLTFIYEDGLRALPTMAIVVGGTSPGFIEAAEIDYRKVVHAEQRLTLVRPLPAAGEGVIEGRCVGVVDKGREKGALVYFESTVKDREGEPYAIALSTLYCRGDGGIEGASGAELRLPPPPDRAPDMEVVTATLPQQAAIYRLIGDRNPLHIDKRVANSVGFEKPILHGLCTYGIAGRAILNACADDDPARIVSFDAKFASPVYPGDELVTRIWQHGNQIAFECLVPERGATVIRNGSCLIL